MAETTLPRSRGKSLHLGLSWEKVASIGTAVIILYLVALPLCTILFSSVRETTNKLPFEDTAFTLANYVGVFTSEATYILFLNTLWYALGSLAIAITLATLFAWFLERGRAPIRSVLMLLVLAPMATPPINDAMAWALLASPSVGLFNTALRSVFGLSGEGPLNIYSIPGMALVTGLKIVPSVYIMLSGPIARFDPSLEEASLTSRVSPIGTLRRVTFPLLRPAVLATCIYFLMTVLELFDIPAVLGMPRRVFVFSTLIYSTTHPSFGLPNYGVVSVYATIFLVIGGVLIYLYGLAVRRKEQFAVVTGKGYRAKLFDFGRWTWLLVALILLYFLFSFILPLAILVWTSLGLTYKTVEIQSLSQASLNAYQKFLRSPDLSRAAMNTAIVATIAATASMVLATLASWLSTRSTVRGATIPDRLTILVVATPSIVIALALIFFYIWVPLPIYGTIWIIVIALSARFLGYSTRLMGAAYLQIHKELEEASLASGVSWLHTIRRILLPLVWPSFARGWLWVFVHAMRDTTMAIMLFTVSNDTIGVRLWVSWFTEGNIAQASGIAVLLALASIALSFLIARMTTARSAEL